MGKKNKEASLSAKKPDAKKVGKNRSNKEVNSTGVRVIDQILSFIFIAVVLFIPLIVRGHVNEYISPIIAPGPLSTGLHADVFTYYKWTLLIGLAATSLLLTIIKLTVFKAEIRNSHINFPLLVLATLAILSGILSEYKGLSLFGMYDEREGLITILCSYVFLFTAANAKFDKKMIYGILAALSIVVIINASLGIAKFYGFDALQNASTKALIMPAGLEMEEGSSLRSTLLNPNYASGLAGAALVLFFSMAILLREKRIRLFSAFMVLISIVMLTTSLSSSGILVVIVLLPIITGFSLIKNKSENRKKIIVSIILITVTCGAVVSLLNLHNPQAGKEIANIFQISTTETDKIGEDWIGKDFGLPRPGWGLGTGRIYIWEKTVGLIAMNPILGHGPGTLAYYFPQYDKSVAANLYSYTDYLTKPHNMYLGIAFDSGVPALLVLLFLFGRHFFLNARSFTKKIYDEKSVLIMSFFFFWCAFAMQWMFNDTFIGTSSIFWVIFGIGASLMYEENSEIEAS